MDEEAEAVEALRTLLATPGTGLKRKQKPLPQLLDEAYVVQLQAKGLTERGLHRVTSPCGVYVTQERRCRPGLAYQRYFREVEPELHQIKTLDFWMSSAEIAARAEDIIMLWAYVHNKGMVLYDSCLSSFSNISPSTRQALQSLSMKNSSGSTPQPT